MKNTKNITKIIITCTNHNDPSDSSILTITATSISCKYTKNPKRHSFDWSYQSGSYEFMSIFSNIAEITQKYIEQTLEINQESQYNFSIIYDDNTDFTIRHFPSTMMSEELFGEIHKLVPQLDELPPEYDTNETLKKRIEDLGGDFEHTVRFEDTEGDDID